MFTLMAKKIKSKISEWERIANSAKQGFTVLGRASFNGVSGDYQTDQEYTFLSIIDKTDIDKAVAHISQLLSIDGWRDVVIEKYSEVVLSEYSDKELPDDWQQELSEQGAFYIIYVENDA